MKLSGIKGIKNAEYNDVEIRLLIKNSEKKSNQPAKGDLALVLGKIGLDDSATYWDLKKAVWKFLNIENPIKLPAAKRKTKTIFERQINKSAEITVLRKKEGLILTSLFFLSKDPEKADLDKALVNRILNTGE